MGTGVAGLCAAYGLQARHDVTVFEAEDRVGGHVHTVAVDSPTGPEHVDTGFIVFNRRNYPLFSALLDRLGVATVPSDMSFSVSSEDGAYEFRGDRLGPWVQRSNVVSVRHAKMLYEILRFHRLARAVVREGRDDRTLAEFLSAHGFSQRFREFFLIPLGSAIWSADPASFDLIPVLTLSRFLDNHGMLSLKGCPRWSTIAGGSDRYVEALTKPFAHRIRRACPVHKVIRAHDSVTVLCDDGPEVFDAVVLALHSDDALGILGDPTPLERSILSGVRYQTSTATLHTDARMMPRRRAAWASWNAYLPSRSCRAPTVTYWMNRLQRLSTSETFLVTLNREYEIDPARIIGQWEYAHPVLDRTAVAQQRRRGLIQGGRRTWYCGAYWGYGFHEDGVRSALDVCVQLGAPW